jgi:LacI family transcriptional regulator
MGGQPQNSKSLQNQSPTLKEVATMAGVSTATVSRVMNRDSRISLATSQRVQKIIDQLGYSPNPFARGLKTKKSRTIGFIVPEFTNDFFMKIARGMESRLRQEQYALVICNANENVNDEEQRLNLLLDQGVDGLLVIPSSDHGAHFLEADRRKIPLVLVDRLVRDYQTDAILVDNINGSYQAVELAIQQGMKSIGFIGGSPQLTSAKERYAGFTRALEDYHLPLVQDQVIFGDFHQDSGYTAMEKICQLSHPPQGVFLSNVFMHLGAAKYLLEHKYHLDQIPEIIGFDELDLSYGLGFCHIMVRQPVEEIGVLAAQTLLDRIHGVPWNGGVIRRLKTQVIQSDGIEVKSNTDFNLHSIS